MSYQWQAASDTEQDKAIKEKWARTLKEPRPREQTRDWSDTASARGASFIAGLVRGRSKTSAGIKHSTTSFLKTITPRKPKSWSASKRRIRKQRVKTVYVERESRESKPFYGW